MNYYDYLKNNQDRVFYILLSAFFLIKYLYFKDVLFYPPYWDEYAYDLASYREGNLSMFLPWTEETVSPGNHPPGFYFTIAINYFFQRLIGIQGFFPAHSLALVFSFLCHIYTYKISKEILSYSTALIVQLILFFSTYFFAQASMILPDIPTLTLGLMYMYIWFKEKNYNLAMCIGIFCSTYSELSLAYTLPVFVFTALWHLQEKRKDFLTLAKSFIPVLVLMLHFVYLKIMHGQFTNHPVVEERILNGFSFFTLDDKIYFIIKMKDFFKNNFGEILTILSLILGTVLFIFKTIKEKRLNYLNLSILLSCAFNLAFFCIYGDYHARNITPLLILFPVTIGYVLDQLPKYVKPISGLIVVALIININLKGKFDTGDTNIYTYIAQVENILDSTKFFDDKKYKEEVICLPWNYTDFFNDDSFKILKNVNRLDARWVSREMQLDECTYLITTNNDEFDEMRNIQVFFENNTQLKPLLDLSREGETTQVYKMP